MLNNLLLKFPVSDGAFYAVFGFVFVFIGIALLIAIVWAIGKIITAVNGKKAKNAKEKAQAEEQKARAEKREQTQEEGISPEIVAAITAALTAFYGVQEQKKCDFIVKRIKRI